MAMLKMPIKCTIIFKRPKMVNVHLKKKKREEIYVNITMNSQTNIRMDSTYRAGRE
jgi:hypothetical protein